MKGNPNIKIYSLAREDKIEDELLESINNLLRILSPKLDKISRERLDELINNPLFELYLLEITGEIAGMASLHYMETLAKKSAWVEDVVVHPLHQGKGLGKKIMKHITDRAKKKGVKHIDLTSSPHRKVANNLYKKLKFKPRKTNVYRLKIKK
jgi:GNAT superfamily N-acetyltransferase